MDMDCPLCNGHMNDVSKCPHPDWPVLFQCPNDSTHKFFIGAWATGMKEDELNHVPDGFDSDIQAKWKYREEVVFHFTPVKFKPKLPILKACPFCGGKAQLSECADYTSVFCTKCSCRGAESRVLPVDNRKKIVITEWNKRST